MCRFVSFFLPLRSEYNGVGDKIKEGWSSLFVIKLFPLCSLPFFIFFYLYSFTRHRGPGGENLFCSHLNLYKVTETIFLFLLVRKGRKDPT